MRRFALGLSLGMMLAPAANAADAPPKVGDKAADFRLSTVDGKPVALRDLTAKGPVVLVVLRGYPGYQCPLCTRQVREFVAKADTFRDAGASVLMIYPGPSEGLAGRAEEFLKGQALPEGFTLALDPDYAFTDAYHLRWNAPNETAYPSTFVIDRNDTIRLAKVSKTHGGRAETAEVIKALAKKRVN